MGNTTILDILGSTITFGLLFLVILRLNANASESTFAYNSNYLLQRNMLVITVMLEQDLNNIGVGANAAYGGIELADTNRLRFLADMTPTDGIANPVIVEWFVGPTSELPETQNSNDRYVYRTVDGKQTKMNLGVTKLTFTYWDIADPTPPSLTTPITPTSTPVGTGNIGPVEVFIKIESPYKMKQDYMADTTQYEMVWRQLRSVSRNNSSQF